ncbi:phage major capsid protein [Lysinibacillus sphaericus]|uniref:HK97 family phage major capsid protein n=2 Tax=Lysinibacillus sphaericus TaxID=1421 RepID=A0A2S0K5L0_LYSSH|nr:phage major capsid protein [Lysinibacillus sphaericus]AVK98650.1 phage capsid protein [Lysinibacillus sphaericus]MED4543175.1 phage major capsid protein [Lysinibacillus sphaericus]TKI16482.1 phage major capsid protein [Lysinibacillus sphaericus]SUV15366.1 HK97 family phage major capsid protein [Lysinibacillus sphaericus]
MKNSIKKVIETRSMPSLVEQRNNLLDEMDNLLKGAKEETRALTEEEATRFDEIKNEIAGLDKTITALDEARSLDKKVPAKQAEQRTQEEAETRAFDHYIRGLVEERADVNLTVGANGAVIPSSIANKIIQKVYDISPIYQLATRYNVGGTLSIPYYDESAGTIEMAYSDEFVDLESTSGKFGSIELKGFLAGALSKVSKSLVNNSQFDLVSFVVGKMAESIAKWIENQLLNGTPNKVTGLSTVTQSVTAAAATVLTADELIDVQEEVPDAFQGNAIWIMNKTTRKAIRKLKDGQGNYLLNKDATARWGYTLLGKDVYTSDNMPGMEAGKTAIFYGDMSGLAVKIAENVSIEILREKYSTQHAIGVVGWIEIDAKVENAQKISKLVMKSA